MELRGDQPAIRVKIGAALLSVGRPADTLLSLPEAFRRNPMLDEMQGKLIPAVEEIDR